MDNGIALHHAFSHNGKFTIQNRVTGEHRTFRVKTQAIDASFAPGRRTVGLLTGKDNENAYTNFAFMDRDGITVWTKKQGGPYDVYARMLYTLVVDGAFSPYAEKYSLQYETVCRVCNRTLTEPESIRTGIGPICAGRAAPGDVRPEVDDNEPDPDVRQMARDEDEYQAGKAAGELRSAERKLYGSAQVELWDMQDEINAYNRGEE